MEVYSPLLYRRKVLQFEDFKKFKISSKVFNRQYASIYNERLKALKNHLLQKAKIRWPHHDVVTISELSEKDTSNPCIIIGILYKYQELKPSILREISEQLQVETQPAKTNYASYKDILYLEDETLRIKLVSNHINIGNLVTGIACAILGHELENGAFSVIDWCFSGCCQKIAVLHEQQEEKEKILIISGLDITSNSHLFSVHLLSEWLNGMIGCIDIQKEVASIVCVIIAGNSIRGSMQTTNHKRHIGTKDYQAQMFEETAMATHKFDNFICQIVQHCPVLLMPGEQDPTCYTLPQQPIHPCITPKSMRFKSFYGITNPWVGHVNSRIIAGSSGQPITDIMKVNGLAEVSPLTWLERTLLWRHYVPTAPDTMPAYPYFQIDPFIITDCPDIYFAGNMEKYDTKLFTADEGQIIRLICIPKFSETSTAVLVDLQNLNSTPISFPTN